MIDYAINDFRYEIECSKSNLRDKIVCADYIPQSDGYKTVFHWGEEDMEQPITFGAISMHSEDVNNFGD